MELRVVVLAFVRAEKGIKGGVVVLHVDDFLLVALLQKWEEGSSHPVHAKDVDGEAFCEMIPEYLSRWIFYHLWVKRRLHRLHSVSRVMAYGSIVDQHVQTLAC